MQCIAMLGTMDWGYLEENLAYSSREMIGRANQRTSLCSCKMLQADMSTFHRIVGDLLHG